MCSVLKAWRNIDDWQNLNGPRFVRFSQVTMKMSDMARSEEHTSELQSPCNLVCRLLLEKKKKKTYIAHNERCVHRYELISASLQRSFFVVFCLSIHIAFYFFFFFFNDTATTEIYTLSLHDALPI